MCKNACSFSNCIWVRTLKFLPEGAKRDKNNNIVECPLFSHDGKVYTLKDKLKKYGFSYRQYCTARRNILNNNLTIKPIKYLLLKRKEEELKASMTEKEYKRYLYLKKVKEKPIEVLGEKAFVEKKIYKKKPKKIALYKIPYKERQALKMGLTLEEYNEYIRNKRIERVKFARNYRWVNKNKGD